MLISLLLIGMLATTGARSHTVPAGGVRTLRVPAAAGEFVHVEIDQGETDLAIDVLAPGAAAPATYDMRERGVELVSFRATVAGTYVLRVRRAVTGGPAVRFTARVERRAWTPADDRLQAAEAEATSARQLFAGGGRERLAASVAARRPLVAVWQSLGREDMAVATLSGIGDALYLLNDHAGADSAYTEALAAPLDARTRAELLNNRGLAALRLADPELSRQLFTDAIAAFDGIGHRPGAALAHSNLGILLRQSANYEAAASHYRSALELSAPSDRTTALATHNLAVVTDVLGQPREALRLFVAAAQRFRARGDAGGEGRTLVARARTELSIGLVERADAHVRRGLRLVGTAGDRLSQADAVELVARVLDRQGHPQAALVHHEDAASRYRVLRNRRGLSDALHGRGESEAAAGALDTAAASLTEALELRLSIDVHGLVAATRAALGRVEARRGRPDAAQAQFEQALAIVDDIQAGVFDRDFRVTHANSIRQIYADYVGLLADRHRREPSSGFDATAFEAVERARRHQLDRLRERQVAVQPAGAAADLARRARLHDEIGFLASRQLDLDAADPARRPLDARLAALRQEYANVDADIRRADPRYGALQRPARFTLRQIQEAIDGRTVLVTFFLRRERSLGFVVTRDTLRMIELPGEGDIAPAARRLAAALSVNPEGTAPAPDVGRRAAALGRLLLDPLAPWLQAPRVVIVPDGAVHEIALTVLPFGGGTLGAARDLVHLPSAGFLLTARDRPWRPLSAPRVAAFADPVFSPDDVRLRGRRASVAPRPAAPAPRPFGRLPSSRLEAADVVAVAGGTGHYTALDFAASKESALDALGRYDVILFATHTAIAEQPDQSGIVLSLYGPDGRRRNGYLRLADVYALRLPRPPLLVVLSACDSAIGTETAGEARTLAGGLAAGFLHSGVPAVVATLWAVDDDATRHFSRYLFEAMLDRDLPPAAAVRAAQAQMRERHARFRAPHYWAGFVASGL